MSDAILQGSKRCHVHLVSDAIGDPVSAIVHATLIQFDNVEAIHHLWWLVRTNGQLERVLEGIKQSPGIVVATVENMEIKKRLEYECAQAGVPFIAPLDGIVRFVATSVGAVPRNVDQEMVRRSPTQFPPRWDEERQEVLTLLAATQAHLRQITSAVEQIEARHGRAGIGHNQPPPDSIISSELIDEGTTAIRSLQEELLTARPRVSVIRLCGFALKRVSAAIKAFLKWLLEKADKVVESVIVTGVLVDGVLGRLTGDLDSIWEHIQRWLAFFN